MTGSDGTSSPQASPLEAGDGRRILLTGAAGFVGSRLARAFAARGLHVYALVRPRSDRVRLRNLDKQVIVLEGDLEDEDAVGELLARASADILVHAAWPVTSGAYLEDRRNLHGVETSMRLFQLAARAGYRRIVGLGTCIECDTSVGYVSEDTPLAPRNLYAAAKAALFLLAGAWAQQERISFAWARLFHLYGPGEHPSRLAPSVITGLLANQSVATTTGEQVRDYLHVDDAASAVAQLALTDLTGPLNVASGRPVRVCDFVHTIGSLLDRESLLVIGGRPPVPGDPAFLCGNPRRLEDAVGWSPAYDLESGLAATISWWRTQCPAHAVDAPRRTVAICGGL